MSSKRVDWKEQRRDRRRKADKVVRRIQQVVGGDDVRVGFILFDRGSNRCGKP